MRNKMANNVEISEAGLINDLERELLTICSNGFDDHEFLRRFRPEETGDVNPNEISVPCLPALYVWCSGLGIEREQVGGMGGEKVSRKFEFYCNIQYILPEVETRQASKELRQIAWWLFNVVDGNLDLNGMVLGPTRMMEMEMFPRWRLVGEEPRSCSTVNIKAMYPHVDRSVITQRNRKR